jgi:hypothetical protein
MDQIITSRRADLSQEAEIARLNAQALALCAEISGLKRKLAEADAATGSTIIKMLELDDELGEARRDAARYRWLRASYDRAPPGVFHPAWGQYMGGNQWKTLEQLDAAIDAAMQEDER